MDKIVTRIIGYLLVIIGIAVITSQNPMLTIGVVSLILGMDISINLND